MCDVTLFFVSVNKLKTTSNTTTIYYKQCHVFQKLHVSALMYHNQALYKKCKTRKKYVIPLNYLHLHILMFIQSLMTAN